METLLVNVALEILLLYSLISVNSFGVRQWQDRIDTKLFGIE
jgi:hypothetical protein